MNLHILLSKNKEWHPAWDSVRQVHDEAFLDLIDLDQVEYYAGPEMKWYEGMFRVRNLPELRQAVLAQTWENISRYLALLSLLEDPDVWLSYSF